MKNGLLESYNSRDCLLVVATYPRINQRYSRQMGGVASFTKNTVKALQKENPGKKFIILTTTLNRKEVYEEDNDTLVIRCIEKNSFFSYLNLLGYILRLSKVKKVLIEFEFTLFGSFLMTAFMIPFSWALFFLGKKSTIVIHPVLCDLRKLYGHFGLAKKHPILPFMNLVLNLFYFLLTIPSENVVVLEDKLKERISNLVGNKVVHISHGVDNTIKNNMAKSRARDILGIKEDEFVVMYFGFLMWYKGVDRLVKSLKSVSSINGQKVKLLIAGGPSLTQEGKKHYKNFINGILSEVRKSKNIVYTGFVPEGKLRVVYEATDLLVLPHRVFISSSGPLSLAASFKKPFILSSNLDGIADSPDFKRAMEFAGVSKKEIFFSFKNKGIISKIEESMNPVMQQKLTKLSENLAKERDFGNIIGMYNRIIFEKSEAKLLFQPSPVT